MPLGLPVRQGDRRGERRAAQASAAQVERPATPPPGRPAPWWLGLRNSAITPISGRRRATETSRITPAAALRACLNEEATGLTRGRGDPPAMPTANSPPTACWGALPAQQPEEEHEERGPDGGPDPGAQPTGGVAHQEREGRQRGIEHARQPPSESSTSWRSNTTGASSAVPRWCPSAASGGAAFRRVHLPAGGQPDPSSYQGL